jgi:hypothetical protein
MNWQLNRMRPSFGCGHAAAGALAGGGQSAPPRPDLHRGLHFDRYRHQGAVHPGPSRRPVHLPVLGHRGCIGRLHPVPAGETDVRRHRPGRSRCRYAVRAPHRTAAAHGYQGPPVVRSRAAAAHRLVGCPRRSTRPQLIARVGAEKPSRVSHAWRRRWQGSSDRDDAPGRSPRSDQAGRAGPTGSLGPRRWIRIAIRLDTSIAGCRQATGQRAGLSRPDERDGGLRWRSRDSRA